MAQALSALLVFHQGQDSERIVDHTRPTNDVAEVTLVFHAQIRDPNELRGALVVGPPPRNGEGCC